MINRPAPTRTTTRSQAVRFIQYLKGLLAGLAEPQHSLLPVTINHYLNPAPRYRARRLMAVVVLGLPVLAPSQQGTSTPGQPVATAPASAARSAQPSPVDMVRSQLVFGPRDARFVLFEFADLQCPDSRNYSVRMFPDLKRDFIDTGRIGYEIRAFPLPKHKEAFLAEAVCRCAGVDGLYHEMRARVFQNQKRLSLESMLQDAAEIGIDPSRIQDCLKYGHFDTMIRAEIEQGQASRVPGTPTLIMARRNPRTGRDETVMTVHEPPDYAFLKQQIEQALRH